MNTPKTDFIFDSAWPRVSDQPRGQHDYLLMVEHARQLETQAQELLIALISAEEKDESIHAFDDLECFVDDPETHDTYINEYQRRRFQRLAIAKAKGG